MYLPFLFSFLIIVLLIWFIIQIDDIFKVYQYERDVVYKNVLNEIKKPDIFDKVKTGNNVSRVLINGSIDIKTIQRQVNEEQEKVDKINNELKYQDFDNKIEEIKKSALILKQKNEILNNELIQLEKEFEEITKSNNAMLLSFPFDKKDLLYYMYKDINDPFQIIFKNKD